MIRIAMAGGAAGEGKRGSFHGNAWAAALNGVDRERIERAGWNDRGTDQRRVDGGKIVKIFDPNTPNARKMAEAFGIDEVAGSPEDLAEDVDAGLIVEPGTFDHLAWARPFLERGLPVYLDKPLALTAEGAREIVAVAEEHGASLLSCSGWRYSDGAERLRAADLGEPQLLVAMTAVTDFDVYAVHPVDMAVGLLGADVQGVANLGVEGREIVRLRWNDGRMATLHIYDRRFAAMGRQFHLFGPAGAAAVADLGAVHPPLLERFLEMCRTKDSPISGEEMIRVIECVEAIREARRQGEEIAIASA